MVTTGSKTQSFRMGEAFTHVQMVSFFLYGLDDRYEGWESGIH